MALPEEDGPSLLHWRVLVNLDGSGRGAMKGNSIDVLMIERIGGS
jgi:hypothetical protein